MAVQNRFKRMIAGTITMASVFVIVFVIVYYFTMPTYSTVGELSHRSSAMTEAKSLPISEADEKKKGSTSYPISLEIPAISVRAKVQHVGIAKSGNMAVPTNYRDVGWFRKGGIPGEVGTAIIAGHVDNAFGLKGVFGDLAKVSPGDEIIVKAKDGTRSTFVVREIDEYDYNDSRAAEEVFRIENSSTLRLITCSGDWIQSDGMYNKRLVVTADLVQ